MNKRPLADTEAAGLSLLAAVCPAGERGAGAKWTQKGQHHVDQVFVVSCGCGSSVVRQKEGKSTVILEKRLLVLPTYIADISQDIFYFGETFFMGPSIFCRPFTSKSAKCILRFG